MNQLVPFNKVGEISMQKPYFPFPVAMNRGLLPDDLTELPELVRPPGVDILAGKIPNSAYAGLVPMGSGKVAAFDHIAGEFHGSDLHIAPAHKDSVNDDGQVESEGLMVVETDEGRIRVAAFILKTTRSPWFIERMQAEGRCHTIGDLAIIAASMFEMPEFEIKDIDSKTGVIVASPRQPVY